MKRVRTTTANGAAHAAQATPAAALTHVSGYLDTLNGVLAAMPREPLARITDLLLDAGRTGKTIFILGNGGSAATASHLACDLAKTASVPGQPRLRALALTDNVPLLTAWGNDASYEVVFAEQLKTFAQPGDLVIAISASGNSPNVLAAATAARAAGARVIGVTGFGGGRLRALCDVCLVVPSHEYGPVEDAHMILVHAVTAALRATLTGSSSVPVHSAHFVPQAAPDPLPEPLPVLAAESTTAAPLS
jgi:D-sedoheptulose 7-phosphate isomerase